MNDNIKHFLDALAAVLAGAVTILDHVVTLLAGSLSIAWYIYRFYEARKAKKNGNVEQH